MLSRVLGQIYYDPQDCGEGGSQSTLQLSHQYRSGALRVGSAQPGGWRCGWDSSPMNAKVYVWVSWGLLPCFSDKLPGGGAITSNSMMYTRVLPFCDKVAGDCPTRRFNAIASARYVVSRDALSRWRALETMGIRRSEAIANAKKMQEGTFTSNVH